MAASEVTIEAAYGGIPVQDNAPTYKVCAGIDTARTWRRQPLRQFCSLLLQNLHGERLGSLVR
ncbi:hypothetical protein D3C73_1136240 [compost metagenome]